MINRERMTDQLLELIQIESPSGREGAMAKRLEAILTGELGMTVVYDKAREKLGTETGNLVATLKGTHPGIPIVFSAHMDTVQQPGDRIRPVLEGGILRSDGTTILGSDDKAGITALIEALRVVREQNLPHGDIQAVFTIWEEGGLLGSANLDYSLIRGERVFVLDSEGPIGSVVNQGPARDRITALFKGKAAHAGLDPETGISAIQMAARAIDTMPLLRIDGETTANIGIIEGGKATNVVTPEVLVVGEARSQSNEKLAVQTERMTKAIRQAAADFGGEVELTVDRMYGAFQVPEEAPILQTLRKAIEAIGLEPIIEASGGGSDTNHFNANGIPAVNLSVGIEEPHSNKESIDLENLAKVTELVVEVIRHHATM